MATNDRKLGIVVTASSRDVFQDIIAATWVNELGKVTDVKRDLTYSFYPDGDAH